MLHNHMTTQSCIPLFHHVLPMKLEAMLHKLWIILAIVRNIKMILSKDPCFLIIGIIFRVMTKTNVYQYVNLVRVPMHILPHSGFQKTNSQQSPQLAQHSNLEKLSSKPWIVCLPDTPQSYVSQNVGALVSNNLSFHLRWFSYKQRLVFSKASHFLICFLQVQLVSTQPVRFHIGKFNKAKWNFLINSTTWTFSVQESLIMPFHKIPFKANNKLPQSSDTFVKHTENTTSFWIMIVDLRFFLNIIQSYVKFIYLHMIDTTTSVVPMHRFHKKEN